MEAAAPTKNYARNLKKSINRTFSTTPCENLAPFNYQNGILQTPPPPPFLYHSFPPFLAQKQPPLLPLPISNGVQHYNNINSLPLNRGFSCPPINRKVNKNGKSKKSKSSTSSPKKEENPKSSKVVMISSTNLLGPNPKHLPKDVSMVFSMSSTGKEEQFDALNFSNLENPKKDSTTLDLLDKVNKFSSSLVFTISPPPSSLPLPTFSLRPKLCCNAEAAAGVDAGATDNLRRLLRLR